MSQLDLIAELRASRPTAPPELRLRVRDLSASAPAPRRRLTWRRALVVVVPVAAAAALAVVLLPGDGDRTVATQTLPTATDTPYDFSVTGSPSTAQSHLSAITPPSAKAASGAERALAPTAPPTSRTRAQRYSATLTVRLPTASAVSAATTRALRIVAALGGYPQTVRVDAAQKDASAYVVVRVPRNRVQDAVRRLGALGTIVGENVSIQDLQAGVDTTGRKIARLQGKLNALRAQPVTPESTKQIAALKTQLERLRLARAATLRAAHYATVELRLQTPPAAPPAAEHEDGPLHDLGVAFRWIGIGAVYALALGAPLLLLGGLVWLLVRGIRRRREERLLSL
jgi:hypothetical protein